MLKLLQILSAIVLTACSHSVDDLSNDEPQLVAKWPLPLQISESSGLLLTDDGRLYTHNDSGNNVSLYELILNGTELTTSIRVLGDETLFDWEAITSDGTDLFIADIGNNRGSREDLNIRKYPLTVIDGVNSEPAILDYSYPDQSDFTPSERMTPFDAETLISYDGRLVIFTKDWVNFETAAYKIDFETGDVTGPLAQLDAQGLITDGASLGANGILLLGYESGLRPFLLHVTPITGGYNLQNRIDLGSLFPQGAQVEGLAIKSIENGVVNVYLSSEAFVASFGGENVELPAELYEIRVKLPQ